MVRKLVGWLGGLVGLVVVVGVLFGLQVLFDENEAKAEAPKVGTCLDVDGSYNASHEELDCDDPAAAFEIVEVGENPKCDETESTYTITDSTDDSWKLCLVLNVEKGDCVTLGLSSDVVDCASEEYPRRALKVDERSAAATCPKQTTEEIKNRTRDRTICLGS